jgi:hypothetical protein
VISHHHPSSSAVTWSPDARPRQSPHGHRPSITDRRPLCRHGGSDARDGASFRRARPAGIRAAQARLQLPSSLQPSLHCPRTWPHPAIVDGGCGTSIGSLRSDRARKPGIGTMQACWRRLATRRYARTALGIGTVGSCRSADLGCRAVCFVVDWLRGHPACSRRPDPRGWS